MESLEIAQALFGAFEKGDEETVRSLCAPDLKAFQNSGPPMRLDDLVEFSLAVLTVAEDFRYEECTRHETQTGFVEEHRVRGRLPDGELLDLAACVVAEVTDGRITVMREYVDGVAARGLRRALASRR